MLFPVKVTVLCLQITLFSVYIGQSEGQNCVQLQNRADRYIKKILLIGQTKSIPRTDSEILDYCRSAKKSFAVGTKYQQCLAPFPRQFLALFISGARKSAKFICDGDSNRREVLDLVQCINERNIGRLYTMVSRTLNIIDFIGTNVTKDSMILPYVCCTYHFVYDRALKLLRSECPDKKERAEKFIQTVLSLAVAEVIDLGCSKLPDLKTCQAKIPDEMENIRSSRLSESFPLEERSIVKSVLRIANRLVDSSPPNS